MSERETLNTQPDQNRPMSNATFGSPVTGPDPAGLSASVLTASQTSTVLVENKPQQPREHKPWHEKITTDMRRHLVQKIVQTIFPTQDPNIYRDPRLTNLVNYAVKTECEMYEQARDQEEYFHLLAERIYKIQKEFEDKTRSRNNREDEDAYQNTSFHELLDSNAPNSYDSLFDYLQIQANIAINNEGQVEEPIRNQQGAQPATTTASYEYVDSLIDRLKTATNQQDKQSILIEIKIVAPAVYQKLVYQNQQQIILRQQQQRQQQENQQ